MPGGEVSKAPACMIGGIVFAVVLFVLLICVPFLRIL